MNRPDCIEEDVSIGPMTTLEVGGAAKYFARCRSVGELRNVLQWGRKSGESVFVLGGGSNILVADTGFDGLVVTYRSRNVDLEIDNGSALVRAEAGVDWDAFVELCVSERLAGLECLSGIPGFVGAAPIQNIGAYGQEVVDSVVSVTGLDMTTLREVTVPSSGCGFGYRTSVFRTRWKTFVVTSVEFRLTRSDVGLVVYEDLKQFLNMDKDPASRASLSETRKAVITIRREKSMVVSAEDPNSRSAGSFFLNPVLEKSRFEVLRDAVRKSGRAKEVPSFPAGDESVKVPAAWLIEQAGYERGTTDGAVGLSSKHALAIINRGGATANEIIGFAAAIKEAVRAAFGVELRPEPVFVGFAHGPDRLLSP